MDASGDIILLVRATSTRLLIILKIILVIVVVSSRLGITQFTAWIIMVLTIMGVPPGGGL